MNEERIKEVFADEEFVKELFSKETPEEAQALLVEKDIELSIDEIVNFDNSEIKNRIFLIYNKGKRTFADKY